MRFRPNRSLWIVVLGTPLFAFGAASAAFGQSAQTGEADRPPAQRTSAAPTTAPALSAAEDAERVRLAAATRLARLGVLFVRRWFDATPEDYRIIAMILDEAHKMAPKDQEILRRSLEAWDAAGDDKAVIDATKQLLALDPKDTVAQLRLISSRVRLQQDADSRMALYDRLLGPDGAKFDASIRSRIALDDAMLARETGDDARFARRLAEATSLDPTNKNAAVLAATYSLPRTAEPLARVELLVNVLLADPLDSLAHLNLARELMSQGAFRGAGRFFSRAADLYAANRIGREEEVRADMCIAAWALDGADAQLARMNEDEKVTKYLLDRRRKGLEASGEDASQVPEYISVPALEVLQLLIATALDRTDDMTTSMQRCSKSLDDELEALATRMQKGEVEEEAAQATSRRLRSELLWLRLLSGLEVEKAVADFEELSEHMTPEARTRYEGWVALRKGDAARALEILTPIVENDLKAQIGFGAAAESLGDPRAACSVYARVAIAEPGAQAYPALPLGLWAKTRIEHLLGEKIRPAASAKPLEDYIARLPREIDDMTKSPRAFMHLEAHHAIEQASALDRDEVSVTLRNTSAIPLALGSGAALNSSLLLAPRLLVQGRQLLREPHPEIVSLDRRLRLLPGESITANVWSDGGETGSLLDQIAGRLLSLRWGVLQGFRMDDSGVFEQGPLCLVTETDLQTRRYPGDPNQPIDEMLSSLTSEHGTKLLEHVLFTNWRMLQVLDEQSRIALVDAPKDRASQDAAVETARLRGQETRRQIALALAERLATMTPDERLVAALIVPPSWTKDSTGHLWDECKPFDEAAMAIPERQFRMAALMLRALSPDDPAFQESIASDDPVLSKFASLLLDRRKRETAVPAGPPPVVEEPVK